MKPIIVKAKDKIPFTVILSDRNSKATIVWEKKIYAEADIKNGKHHSIWELQDNGDDIGTGQSIEYIFKDSEKGKYVKIYAFINSFTAVTQSQVYYVETEHQTDIRIQSVTPNKVTSVIGSTVKLSVVYHKNNTIIPKDKVPQATKDNVKWNIKTGNNSEERLIVNDIVIKGGDISITIPKEWKGREVTLMPYLEKSDLKVSTIIKVLNHGKAVVFFIGGAGDKRSYAGSGPYYNILYAKNPFDKLFSSKPYYKSMYLGYYEIYPEKDIATYVESQVIKEDVIYIVGHSLGGWNAAHLSQILTDKGYNIEMLVTLDPVGEDLIVNSASEIYFKFPKPKSKLWLNIFVDAEQYHFSDFIADMGVQWKPKTTKPSISHITKHSHLNADLIFTDKMSNGKSASDRIFESINSKME